MTEGSIIKQILLFSVPLMFGNVFQMLYNTVDSIVVGNFVGTEALAAVGSTTMICNMVVFFFNGFAVGAGVVIGQFFGSRSMRQLHIAIETTMALTFISCVVFSVLGVLGVVPMLKFMAVPDDVMPEASLYLRIYFAGISGLLIYNMGSSILRAVGDSIRPLIFLIITSLLNTVLDLLFVIGFHMGIEGVAIATILAQFVSAVIILVLLTRTDDIYKMTWHDLRIDKGLIRRIIEIGLPAGIQMVLTAFSNVFVQSYINFFGSACMAGWGCYNKLDSFIMLPMQSMAMAATTFVSQNIGAKKVDRANRGTAATLALTLFVTGAIAVLIVTFAGPAVRLFTQDENVVAFGILFIHTNTIFLVFNCVNHVLAGALRGRGDSRGPMIIMLVSFVLIRQIYLFVVTRFIVNTPKVVGFGYPLGWMACCLIEAVYAWRYIRRESKIVQETA